VHTLAVNIFAAATDRTDNTKQGRLAERAGGQCLIDFLALAANICAADTNRKRKLQG
jgi:hypothetical protein